jgi:hypothetical protein
MLYFVVNLARGTVVGIQCTVSYDKKPPHLLIKLVMGTWAGGVG